MTLEVSFREGTAEDRDAILALRKIVFPLDDPEKQDPRFWDWEFRRGYAGPGRIFVAEANGGIVGHCAFVRQNLQSDETLTGAMQVDVMTHPEFRRLKVYSRLSAFATAQVRDDFQFITAFQIRKAVLAGAMAGGLRSAGFAPILIKPLSVKNGVLHLLRRRATTSEPRRTASIRAIDDSELTLIDPLLGADAVRQPRTPEFLRWRYQQNPAWRYGLEGFLENGELRAFVVHRLTTLRGVPTLAIVDAGLQPGAGRPFRKLLAHVCRNGRLGGAVLAAALMTGAHPARKALRRAGFFPGPHRFRLLLQALDERHHEIESGPWSLSWGDTDHL